MLDTLHAFYSRTAENDFRRPPKIHIYKLKYSKKQVRGTSAFNIDHYPNYKDCVNCYKVRDAIYLGLVEGWVRNE